MTRILRVQLASVTARDVDDGPGWARLDAGPHERDAYEIIDLYSDALIAWRKNPIAWRSVGVVQDFVLGDGIGITSPDPDLNRFIEEFWYHRKNQVTQKVESMLDELTRAGDLFVLLFRNPQDGMSYLRFLAKDELQRIETAENDRELELVYWQRRDVGDPVPWYAPDHPQAAEQDAICLHYTVNRPIGVLFGEGDLVSILPWLQKYNRLLEDRVRLHWAVRAFLWFVTVPTRMVRAKRAQYSRPPESGNVIVKDDGEEWEVKSPNLRGADAAHDIQAVFRFILAGSGFPAHWMGDSSDANLATAKATQRPTERRLKRRQDYFTFVLQDILFHAYQRAAAIGKTPPLPDDNYHRIFTVHRADVSNTDNHELAEAAHFFSAAMADLVEIIPGDSRALRKRILDQTFRFAGVNLQDAELEEMLDELEYGDPEDGTPQAQENGKGDASVLNKLILEAEHA